MVIDALVSIFLICVCLLLCQYDINIYDMVANGPSISSDGIWVNTNPLLTMRDGLVYATIKESIVSIGTKEYSLENDVGKWVPLVKLHTSVFS